MTAMTGILMAGCYGPADYLHATGKVGSETPPIDPERLRVDSSNFSKFRTTRDIAPPPTSIPIRMVDISRDDVWVVRYQIRDSYLITSDSYTDRQCRSLAGRESGLGIAHVSPFTGKCSSRYLYSVYVDMDGNVTGGWALPVNPSVVGFSSDRKAFLKPNPASVVNWGPQPLFEKIK